MVKTANCWIHQTPYLMSKNTRFEVLGLCLPEPIRKKKRKVSNDLISIIWQKISYSFGRKLIGNRNKIRGNQIQLAWSKVSHFCQRVNICGWRTWSREGIIRLHRWSFQQTLTQSSLMQLFSANWTNRLRLNVKGIKCLLYHYCLFPCIWWQGL